MEARQFRVPRFRSIARQAAPKVVEGILAPLAIFYAALWMWGIWPAVLSALAWSWAAIALRVALRRPVPGLLVLGAVGLTARTALAAASNSVFLYFLQPTLGAVVVAIAFLASVAIGRPLASRLAGDFLAMPEAFWMHPEIRRYFARITLLFGVVQLVNAGLAGWLLVSQPVDVFLAAKTIATVLVMAPAIGGSMVWFNRVLRMNGLHADAGLPAAV